ncbi:MAG: hypothetical protein P8I54_07470, partial [Flavobacteriaceae bacterium]|nr:hypothetical protein [Flavobacteriaceae bacterium]
ESIHQANYYKWSKDFMEAGKRRLNGDTMREANTSEVHKLKGENGTLTRAFLLFKIISATFSPINLKSLESTANP